MRLPLRASVLVLAGAVAMVGCTSDSQPSPELASQKGRVLGAAREQTDLAGLTSSAHDAGSGDRVPRADWSVCSQMQQGRTVEFAAVEKGEPCPSEDGKPVPWLKMPDVTGVTVSGARSALTGVENTLMKAPRLVGARRGVNPYADPAEGEPDSWMVCSQRPGSGTALDSRWQAEEDIELHVTQPGTPCP